MRVKVTRKDKDKHGNPITQHYWKNSTQTYHGIEIVRKSGRYRLRGTGKEIGRCVAMIKGLGLIPFNKRTQRTFIEVNARDFLKDPWKYSRRGNWGKMKIET